MFRHEGPARDAKHNTRIAGCLAAVAGYVDVGGLLLLGTFTSHVTGNVGKVAADLSRGELASALIVSALVASYLWGAFGATLILEGSAAQTPEAYGLAIVVQGSLLAMFTLVMGLAPLSDRHLVNAGASLLCMAMGMQNSLVTRLSGAVVRTTHLTGIVTDLGIEAARWYRWYRAQSRPGLPFGRVKPTRPNPAKVALLLTIMASFALGALLGGLLSMRVGTFAMAIPALTTFGVGAYAFSQRA